MTSKEFHNQNFTRINAGVGEMAKIVQLPNGIQAKVMNTGIVLTFFYRQQKYHLNTSNAYVKFTPGKEIDVISKYYQGAPQRAIREAEKVTEVTDKGTQACIDHLNRKQEIILKNNPDDHKLLAFCKTLANEFQQYL